MTRLITTFFAGFLAFSAVYAGAQTPAPNPVGTTVLEFKTRIDEYVKLREQADNTAPVQKPTAEASDIKNAQLALAERIGAARKTAKQGDILTPEITVLFRKLLHSEVKQEKGTHEQIKEDNPGAGVPFKINAQYPDKEPLSTVPANVLETLPPLPKDIEYRFVNKHLILRDVRANLIIDYLLNAIP